MAETLRNNRNFRTTSEHPRDSKEKRSDGKLLNKNLDRLKNYLDKEKLNKGISSQTINGLSQLKSGIEYQSKSSQKEGESENLTDTIAIQRKEQQYIASHETMNESEYNKLFSGKEKMQQGQLGDCYLVSGLHELAKAQHFDTLMRTSIQRMKRSNGDLGYQIKIPLGEPSGRKILIKNSEIPVAKIRGNDGYKLLELAYAKNKLRKNDKEGNKYTPITEGELKKISGGWTNEVLQSFLGKNNIGFSDFGTMKNYKKGKTLSQSPQNVKDEIHNFLKNYNPSIGNKFVSLASLPGSDDRKTYTVGGKTIYRRHAYSLTGVKKDSNGNVNNITVLNPWNREGNGKNYQIFTLDEFFMAFSAISCGKIKTSTFLDEN